MSLSNASPPSQQKEETLNDNIAAIEMEADLNQARRTAVMAHNVVIRLRELGLPDTLDAELASVSTDLGDLWGAQKEFTDHLHNMLKTSHDWDSVGDSLVDMRASIEHIAWHLDSIREPLTKLAEYAYSQAHDPATDSPPPPGEHCCAAELDEILDPTSTEINK